MIIKKVMKSIVQKIKRIKKLMPHLREAYKRGGYTNINIAQVSRGNILSGKSILITGGGSGIGLAIAKKCIDEGAKVIITGRNFEKLEKAKTEIQSDLLHIVKWDVSDVKNIDDNIVKCELLIESDIDILINNAGVMGNIDFESVTEEDWYKVYNTNVKGTFFLTQKLCKKWQKTRANGKIKKIINIASQGGIVGATYPYRMSKWDLIGMTKGLALKYADSSILINAIAPGIILTDMQSGLYSQEDNAFIKQNPVKRYALPEEIAELALFMISDACNFIVGQTVVCDGGYVLK